MNFTNDGVQGADVSFYQDNNQTPQQIDFTKMVGQGASFVIVRAGQNLWIDPDFAYNWRNARVAGLPRGSYWFYDSRVSPIQQATIFASLFTNDPPELELWLDLEEHYGGFYGGSSNWRKFLDKLRELLPTARIGIYTGYYYISGRIPSSEYPYYSQYPLWLAWYTFDDDGNPHPEPENVLIPAPWQSCLYWQWGTPVWGLAWGCESIEIDMNLFNGNTVFFNDRYNLEEIGEPMITYHKIKSTATPYVNIRSGPGPAPTYADIGDLYPGDVVESDSSTNGWLHILRYWHGDTRHDVPDEAYCKAEFTEPTTAPKQLTNIIEVYSDGSVNVIPSS